MHICGCTWKCTSKLHVKTNEKPQSGKVNVLKVYQCCWCQRHQCFQDNKCWYRQSSLSSSSSLSTSLRMATEGMAIMSEGMEPGQGPELGHRLPQVLYWRTNITPRRGGIWIFRWCLKAKLSLACHYQSNQIKSNRRQLKKNFETNLSLLWDSCDTKFTKLWHKFNTILTHLWQNLDTSLRNFLDYFATILVDLRGNFGAAQWLPTSERTFALWTAYIDIFPHEVFRRNTLCNCSVKAYIKCSLLLY